MRIKIFSILLLFGLLVSCISNDEPKQDIDCLITVTFDNIALVNKQLYVAQDYTFEIESVEFKPAFDKTDDLIKVEYLLDNELKIRTTLQPYKARFNFQNLSTGQHTLRLRFNLVQDDDMVCFAQKNYNINVVPSERDIPNNAELGTYTHKFKTTE